MYKLTENKHYNINYVLQHAVGAERIDASILAPASFWVAMAWWLQNYACNRSQTRLKCPWAKRRIPNFFPGTMAWAAYRASYACSLLPSRVCSLVHLSLHRLS